MLKKKNLHRVGHCSSDQRRRRVSTHIDTWDAKMNTLPGIMGKKMSKSCLLFLGSTDLKHGRLLDLKSVIWRGDNCTDPEVLL